MKKLLLILPFVFILSGCENMTPEQIESTSKAISDVARTGSDLYYRSQATNYSTTTPVQPQFRGYNNFGQPIWY